MIDRSLIKCIHQEIKEKEDLRKNNREYKEYFDTYIGFLVDYLNREIARSRVATISKYVITKEDGEEDGMISAAKFIIWKVGQGYS